MNIVVAGIHLQSDPTLENYATEKVQKLEKFHPKIEKITVRVISEQSHREKGDDFTCEIIADIPGKNVEVSETGQTAQEAIDKASDRMKILLVKHKEKTRQHNRKA